MLNRLLLCTLYHRTNAFGTKRFLNFFAIFDDGHFLEVRFEDAVGCPQRETSVMAESRCFAT